MEIELTDRLTALSHPQRLAVFRLLMRRYPDALPAGEISDVLRLKASTASVYLSALTQTGLIVQRRAGTRLLYSVNLTGAQEIVSELFLDCCRGRADLCAPVLTEPRTGETFMTEQKYNVLFICTGNSARSIFAETLLRDLGGDRFNAWSAGTSERSELNPYAVEVLRNNGHDISHLRSKNVSEFQGPDAPALDFVFTVCDRAANEACPPWSGQPVSGHWGMPDPVKATGTGAEQALAFRQAYAALRSRISIFVALPFESLDRKSLQNSVDDIGRETVGAVGEMR